MPGQGPIDILEHRSLVAIGTRLQGAASFRLFLRSAHLLLRGGGECIVPFLVPRARPDEVLGKPRDRIAERPAGGGVGRPIGRRVVAGRMRSEEHTSELQSLMRISYAVFCLKKK